MNAPQLTQAEQLYKAARNMLPALRERVEETARLGHLPDATVAAMQEAGFFRIMQPARYGGFEMDPEVFFKVQMILAEACMSTAWVLGVVAIHNWQLALFDDRAQRDVWGEDDATLISSSYMPVGKVKRVEGGFRLYSPEDMERIDRIRQFKELLGFSLAEIKEMLDAEDVRLQIKAGWRKDADSEEKAKQGRMAREATLQQIQLIDQKMEKMASLREQLAERVKKYDELLHRFAEADHEPATTARP